MGIALGILLGLFAAGGIALLCSVFVLAKSNDYGNKEPDIEQYTGYEPVQIYNAGQVSGPGSSGGLFSGSGW